MGCAPSTVRLFALRAIESGEALLLRILPDESAQSGGEDPGDGDVPAEEGTATVNNPCLSGGAIEIFLEPVLPAPRVLVAGDTPIVGALQSLGPELGLEIVAASHGDSRPESAGGELALVVAAHGREELAILRAGLESGLPYVGLVASGKRGAAVIAELRADGVPDDLLAAVDTPAGIPIGARTPAEIALSVLARIVAVRRDHRLRLPARGGAVAPPITAVDPVCGMTVVVVEGTPAVEYQGETVYFCCVGCQGTFESQHEHAVAHS